MTDPSKRPLTFPKWHIPYLEKHQIVELLRELARELIIQQPEDHINFMKTILQKAAASKNACRLILIGSMKINRIAIADEIAKYTQQVVFNSVDIASLKNCCPNKKVTPTATILASLVKNFNLSPSGWIIADCINTQEEAKELLRLGVLPTHVIQLITPFQPNLNEPIYCEVPEHWPQLRRNLFGLKEVFSKKIKEVNLENKSIPAVAEDCFRICTKRDAVKTVRPRVVILGPRGCGRKTQARLLAQMLGLTHVDFEYVLCQAWTAENELGAKLRQCNKRVCFHSELLCQIINKRILEKDCLENGWVLTGYPYTVTDFQFLDCLQTPPNRVIVLDCDLNVAKERIRNRYINVYTGSTTNLNKNDFNREESLTATDKKVLKQHPKDDLKLIQAEHDFYCAHYGSIKKYCGDTLMVVNGEQHERWVYECILAYIVGGNPVGSPRKGFGEDIPEVCSCECITIPSKIAKAYAITV